MIKKIKDIYTKNKKKLNIVIWTLSICFYIYHFFISDLIENQKADNFRPQMNHYINDTFKDKITYENIYHRTSDNEYKIYPKLANDPSISFVITASFNEELKKYVYYNTLLIEYMKNYTKVEIDHNLKKLKSSINNNNFTIIRTVSDYYNDLSNIDLSKENLTKYSIEEIYNLNKKRIVNIFRSHTLYVEMNNNNNNIDNTYIIFLLSELEKFKSDKVILHFGSYTNKEFKSDGCNIYDFDSKDIDLILDGSETDLFKYTKNKKDNVKYTYSISFW